MTKKEDNILTILLFLGLSTICISGILTAVYFTSYWRWDLLQVIALATGLSGFSVVVLTLIYAAGESTPKNRK